MGNKKILITLLLLTAVFFKAECQTNIHPIGGSGMSFLFHKWAPAPTMGWNSLAYQANIRSQTCGPEKNLSVSQDRSAEI